jgi:hypothetical protein
MKPLLVVCGKDQITWEVFVLRVRFDDLLGVNGLENSLACNRAVLETHVNMIGPKDRLLPDAGLDKRQRIIGKLTLRRFHESIPLIGFLCYTVLSARRRAVWQDDVQA